MKLIDLIWVLALAGTAAACNSGPPITGEKAPVPGCSPVEDACQNAADQATYAELTYTNAEGDTFTGEDAASEIGADCIFGSDTSVPPLAGCGAEAANVIFCFPSCPPETIAVAAACVADCTQEATGLSDECVACTGETVACGAAFCTDVCASDPNAQVCIDCRCANNCIQCFDQCSGNPSDNECG